jgi:hypothetical protein
MVGCAKYNHGAASQAAKAAFLMVICTVTLGVLRDSVESEFRHAVTASAVRRRPAGIGSRGPMATKAVIRYAVTLPEYQPFSIGMHLLKCH